MREYSEVQFSSLSENKLKYVSDVETQKKIHFPNANGTNMLFAFRSFRLIVIAFVDITLKIGVFKI